MFCFEPPLDISFILIIEGKHIVRCKGKLATSANLIVKSTMDKQNNQQDKVNINTAPSKQMEKH